MVAPFLVYRSSAGSGKTRTLAKEYLALALRWNPDYFRHILAVTFANKATQEMKDRILFYLNDFITESKDPLGAELAAELKLSPAELRLKARAVQSAILHQYGAFAISTIDAFFQRVIRSFTREAGLLGNFRLEVENELVMEEVISQLFEELGNNAELTDWVVGYASERLRDGENWNIRKALKEFSSEIFSEEFAVIEGDVMARATEAGYFKNTKSHLQGIVARTGAQMQQLGQEALDLISKNGLTVDDFAYKDQGTPYSYFRKCAARIFDDPKPRIIDSAADPEIWAPKTSKRKDFLTQLAAGPLGELLNKMLALQPRLNSAQQLLENFNYFGLLIDITRKLKDYKAENNLMLLSDAPRFLNGVIAGSDTPFIYEKVGSWFRNYLIDEFQDTSHMQWSNFKPLLRDALDQQYRGLVVGDVKQSIYRWRGGDLELLQSQLVPDVGADRTELRNLSTNFRSAEHVVSFNNELFTTAASLVQQATGGHTAAVYADIAQQPQKYPGAGYVEFATLEDPAGEKSFEDLALERLPAILEQLQDQQVPLRDIAILVRRHAEGNRIAEYLLNYKQSAAAKPGYRYDVISNELLRLDQSSCVSLLLSAFRHLYQPDDPIARATLAYESARRATPERVFANAALDHLSEFLPEEFVSRRHWLAQLPVYELIEELVRIFRLHERTAERAYLQGFQDTVLDFSRHDKNDIGTFLEWWEEVRLKKSVIAAATADAVNIYTIHKSKGLQYRFVLIPFCHWKLDHDKNPVMWVTATEDGFADLGPLPVHYKGNLVSTYFREAYEVERAKAWLDNLNLLYVACTRAEEGLIAFSPPKPKNENLGHVGLLVLGSIKTNLQLLPNFDTATQTFRRGSLAGLSQPRQESEVAVNLEHYGTYDWRSRLVIKREGHEWFDEATTQGRQKANYGIMLHAILARVKFRSDWQQAVESYCSEQQLSETDAVGVRTVIEKIMGHRLAASWFETEWSVRTEVPVLLPGGESRRIDRFIEREGKAIIIDYKTGTRKAADQQQVAAYLDILRQMGYGAVEGYLFYFDNLEVVPVSIKPQLELF